MSGACQPLPLPVSSGLPDLLIWTTPPLLWDLGFSGRIGPLLPCYLLPVTMDSACHLEELPV